MHFSADYTHYAIAPQVGGGGFHLTLTLHLTLEIDWYQVGTAAVERVIVTAMNRFAGGQRTLRGTSVWISWVVVWVPNVHLRRMSLVSNRELGVLLLPADIIAAAHAHVEALFCTTSSGSDRISRMVLPAEHMLPPPTRQRVRRGRRRRPTAEENAHDDLEAATAHELGHGHGLRDDHRSRASLMYHQMLTPAQRRALRQQWPDAELIVALRGLFPDATRPTWLA